MNNFGTYFYLFLFASLVTGPVAQADSSKNQTDAQKSREQLEESFRAGVQYQMDQYLDKSGAWPGPKGEPDVAMTAMVVDALADGPETYRQKYQEEYRSGVQYILDARQENGSILDAGKIPRLVTYKTSLAIMALVSAKSVESRQKEKKKIQKTIDAAKEFLTNTQFSESYHNVGRGHPYHGGFDYDHQEGKPDADLSNTQFALEALDAANLPEDHEVWKRAAVFLQRTQNFSETNDLKEFFREKGLEIGNDGGFMYYPGKSYGGNKTLPNGREIARSYGSMTYAGLKSYIYANLDKDDPRVKAAYRWIQRNYTLSRNPGMARKQNPERGKMALYYYYHTFAKALDRWGKKYVFSRNDQGEKEEKHHWARELTGKLYELQHEDGYWKNDQGRWMEDYPVLVTSYSLMALNICRDWITKN